ncbi:hypothetical protein OG272_02665 [Streptomyces sp. NBC_00104]|uniref:alpha/beta fold hydrolase n=1 Tax=Streptomyces sp. NBC_00104 TaxID=2903621 RepID=UPI0032505575
MTETSPYVPPAHIVGSGADKVIVLHSLFAGHESFSPWWPYLDGTRFSYAFMDARGFGDAIDVTGSYTCDEIASDVLLLADPVGTPRRSGCPAPTRTRPSHTASIAGSWPPPSRPPLSRRRRSPSAMCSTNRRPGPR